MVDFAFWMTVLLSTAGDHSDEPKQANFRHSLLTFDQYCGNDRPLSNLSAMMTV